MPKWNNEEVNSYRKENELKNKLRETEYIIVQREHIPDIQNKHLEVEEYNFIGCMHFWVDFLNSF